MHGHMDVAAPCVLAWSRMCTHGCMACFARRMCVYMIVCASALLFFHLFLWFTLWQASVPWSDLISWYCRVGGLTRVTPPHGRAVWKFAWSYVYSYDCMHLRCVCVNVCSRCLHCDRFPSCKVIQFLGIVRRGYVQYVCVWMYGCSQFTTVLKWLFDVSSVLLAYLHCNRFPFREVIQFLGIVEQGERMSSHDHMDSHQLQLCSNGYSLFLLSSLFLCDRHASGFRSG